MWPRIDSGHRATPRPHDQPSFPLAVVTDAAEAQRFVVDRYGARAGSVTLVGAGEWSRAYAFALDGRPVVVRFGAHGEDFAKDWIMAGVSSAALPIPEFIDMGPAPGGYFAVSVRAYGVALDELDEPAMRAVLPALLSALDAIRDLAPPTRAGYGLWPAGGRGPADTWATALLSVDEDRDRLPRWRERLATSRAGESAFREGFAKLTNLVGDLSSERHVIHGDLLNRNVLVDGGRISAVLDWGNALYGDHLYDAAWLIHGGCGCQNGPASTFALNSMLTGGRLAIRLAMPTSGCTPISSTSVSTCWHIRRLSVDGTTSSATATR